ncbi:transglycosylase SLT domain-containing protein [Methylomonas sp. MgM2]
MKFKSLRPVSLVALSACANIPPHDTGNICEIFREKDDWYRATLAASQRWGVPIAVQMSIIHQESRFVADAEPPRPTILGFIPWFRSSSAYGYPQAQDGTWSDYQQQSGNNWADRDDFADSCDFVAWYCAMTHQKLGIPVYDANNLYLAYHEGLTGYRRRHYQNKGWLINVAQKVHRRAWQYDAQLATCRQELENEN